MDSKRGVYSTTTVLDTLLPNTLDRQNSRRYSQRSHSSDNGSLIMPIFHQLQMKLAEFEGAGFPALVLPNSQKKPKPKKKARRILVSVTTELPPPPIVRSYIAEETQFHPLSATATFNTNKHNLGPGKYEVRRKLSVKGGHLSSMPRFSDNFIQIAESYLEHKSPKVVENGMIMKNKDMSQFSKEQKLQSLQNSSKIREFEELVHRKTKVSLEEAIKEKRIRVYNEKISKFEWRMNKVEIQHLRASWMAIINMFALATVGICRLKQKKFELQRVGKFLSRLYYISIIVGKMKRVLNRARWNALMKIAKKHSYVVVRWVGNRKKQYFGALGSIFDRVFMHSMMSRLLTEFQSKIILIQSSIRSMLKVKRIRNWGLTLLFKKIEVMIMDKKLIRSNSRDLYSLKPEVVDSEIRKYYITNARKYAEAMIDYKKKVKLYFAALEKPSPKKLVAAPIYEISSPKKPMFFIYTKTDDAIKKIRQLLGMDLNKLSPVRKVTNQRPLPPRRQSILK